MNFKFSLFFPLFISLSSCSVSDREFLEEIERSERVEITQTFHGGIGGSGEINYVLKRSGVFPEKDDWILIRDENTQFQTYILIDSIQLNNFKSFVVRAFETNDLDRTYQNSCAVFGSNPNEYDFNVNGYSRDLQPNVNTDSLFYSITKKFCLSKHVYE